MGFTRTVMVLACIAALPAYAQQPRIDDVPFEQEYHEAYPLSSDTENDVNGIAVDADGRVWAATRAGVRVLADGKWTAPSGASGGVAFDIVCAPDGTVWFGAWDGLYAAAYGEVVKLSLINEPISAVCLAGNTVHAAGPEGLWSLERGTWTHQGSTWPRSLSSIAFDAKTGLWFATGLGLYNKSPKGDRLYYRQPEELVSGAIRGVAFTPDGRVWAGGMGGVTVLEDGVRVGAYTPADGVANNEVRCIAYGPDGRIWIGTDLGVVRFDETSKSWSLRHSRRWLLHDAVRDIAFDKDGTAWIATRGGVSAIKRRSMTLEEKAAHFLAIQHERHVRDPWIVERCKLAIPGDVSTWTPEDDDNDGSYTACYMIQESFRYAVTKDPEAKQHAKSAFEFLEFLQTVTQTPGFVARTVVPSTWTDMHDGNETISIERRAEARVRDPRWKPVEQRWRPSADGKWLWKGDTSSDEITGHFYGYIMYYMLAADDADKQRVAALARRVMDYIIDGGYVLNDIDGTHTRWAVWSPEKLLHDPDWRAERGINATELLMFLKVTHYMTGDAKYQDHYQRLISEHGYAEIARRAKTYHPSERTHIDDELLCFTYPGLLLCEKDPQLLGIYKESLDWWYQGLAKDESPYFNFSYGALGGKEFNPEAGVAFLRDAPLDLVEWTIDNTPREDLKLVRAPEIDPLQTDRMLPADERAVMRWDKNPWMAVNGNGGHSESSGTYWLLPYWMGRYYGYIGPGK